MLQETSEPTRPEGNLSHASVVSSIPSPVSTSGTNSEERRTIILRQKDGTVLLRYAPMRPTESPQSTR